jgi:uncharacterized small protein (DUF1192 family)
MAQGTVIKTDATSFEVTRTITLPQGGEYTKTTPYTLTQLRAGIAQLNREIDRITAQLDILKDRKTDFDAELTEAITQGVEERS